MNQQFGICNLALVPLRESASHQSEMTSQLLFGDHFEIIEFIDKWILIRTAYDDYHGWINAEQYTCVDINSYVALHDLKHILGLQIDHTVTQLKDKQQLNLIAGSSLSFFETGQIRINDELYEVAGSIVVPDQSKFNEEIISAARFYLHTPYLWGGRSPFGIDCSGLTQMVFKQFGIRLKRDARQQVGQGIVVDFLQSARAGDLAFFDNDEGNIVHVGIMLGNQQIIHASGRVRIDAIDNQGIYSEELKRYTHKLRIIKRLSS